MNRGLNAEKITDRIYWVGAVDWELRDFHGYATQRGSTYNAFLILTDKVTLIDTVKKPFKEEMLSRIASVIDPHTIDYIVSNHAEMDHSGCLPDVIQELEPEKVFASPSGVKALADHFHMAYEITPMKSGERLDLGGLHLSFLETRMLHWPDSMFTYVEEEETLFSQDAFGCHLATNRLFADEVPGDILEFELAKYYANILLPYSQLITKLIRKVAAMGLSLKRIFPDHGPLWRDNVEKPLQLYARWAEQEPTDKAVIIYDTMWQSTSLMAKVIGKAIAEKGADVAVMPLKGSHRSDIATELLAAGALLVGSPTMNNNIFPSVIDALTYLKGLKPRNLIGAAFGSYGWSGEAVKQANEILDQMKVERVSDGINSKYVPGGEVLKQCRDLGSSIGERLARF